MFSFTKAFLNIFTAFSLFAHTHLTVYHNFPTPSITPSSAKSVMLRATGSINQFGKTANLAIAFPQNGGAVTGNISGDCTGKIKGIYSGVSNGKQLQGTAYANCPVLLLNIYGEATFNGTVNDNNTSTNVNYEVKANNHSQNGTFTFTISPQ